MSNSLQKKGQMCKIWRPPFGGGPRPMAPMAPIDEKALIAPVMCIFLHFIEAP